MSLNQKGARQWTGGAEGPDHLLVLKGSSEQHVWAGFVQG